MRIEIKDNDMYKFVYSLEYAYGAFGKDTHAWDDYVKKHPDVRVPRNGYEELLYRTQRDAKECREYVENLIQDVKWRNTVNAYCR